MSGVLKLLFPVWLCALCLPAQTAAPDESTKPIVLQKNEGELRTRRPREGVSSPSTDFLLKIGPFQAFVALSRGVGSRCCDPETQTSCRG